MFDQLNTEEIKEKLYRALKAKAVLAERSKLLAQQINDSRMREERNDHLVRELLDRQRELNFMLHRANTVLHRIQEANAALSSEFTELVKELPKPSAPDWQERVAKINELFRKTGAMADEVADEIFRKSAASEQARSAETASAGGETKPNAAQMEPELVSKEDDPQLPSKHEPEPDLDLPEQVCGTKAKLEMEDSTIENAEQGERIGSPDLRKRLDRLFGRTEAEQPEWPGPKLDDNTAAVPDRPNILSWVWRKIAGRGGKDGGSAAEVEPVSDVSEPGETSDALPEPAPGNQTPTEACEADNSEHQPNRAITDLLEDTAAEMDTISLEIVPPAVEGDQFTPGTVPQESESAELTPQVERAARGQSSWSRIKSWIAESRLKCALAAMERAETRRARRENRRLRRPDPGV